VPYLAAIEVDPRRVVVQLTSNRAEITTDLANRSSCVRILKQPEDYRFRRYAEGDVLEHVRANQPLYLGAVFAVVKAWHAAGKPRTDTTGHDFRAWAGKLDWIVQNILNAGPLLEGHRQTQVRMATPVLNWLRDVALAVRDGGLLGTWLRAGDLVDIIAPRPDTELPGLPEGADLADEEVKKKVLQAAGRRMAQCFGTDGVREIDAFRIERKETVDPLNRRTTREYCFQGAEMPPEKCAYGPDGHRRGDRRDVSAACPIDLPVASDRSAQPADKAIESVPCAYGAPMGAPIAAPMKSRCAPIAPMNSTMAYQTTQNPPVLDFVANVDAICASGRRGIEPHRRNRRNVSAPAANPPDEVGLATSPTAPRSRWREQAEALLATVDDPDLREDFRLVYDEREAIASVDGGLGDDDAGRLAYAELVAAVDGKGLRPATTV
jgi:hypothetical protein